MTTQTPCSRPWCPACGVFGRRRRQRTRRHADAALVAFWAGQVRVAQDGGARRRRATVKAIVRELAFYERYSGGPR